jgi:hypothetical protein
MNAIIDFLEDYFGWVVLLVILFIIWLVWLMISSEYEAKQAFMAECMEEKKKYECTAMWRSGDKNTVVVPMPVYTGR